MTIDFMKMCSKAAPKWRDPDHEAQCQLVVEKAMEINQLVEYEKELTAQGVPRDWFDEQWDNIEPIHQLNESLLFEFDPIIDCYNVCCVYGYMDKRATLIGNCNKCFAVLPIGFKCGGCACARDTGHSVYLTVNTHLHGACGLWNPYFISLLFSTGNTLESKVGDKHHYFLNVVDCWDLSTPRSSGILNNKRLIDQVKPESIGEDYSLQEIKDEVRDRLQPLIVDYQCGTQYQYPESILLKMMVEHQDTKEAIKNGYPKEATFDRVFIHPPY